MDRELLIFEPGVFVPFSYFRVCITNISLEHFLDSQLTGLPSW